MHVHDGLSMAEGALAIRVARTGFPYGSLVLITEGNVRLDRKSQC